MTVGTVTKIPNGEIVMRCAAKTRELPLLQNVHNSSGAHPMGPDGDCFPQRYTPVEM